MKKFQRSLLLSLIPLITPLAVYGESDQITEQVTRMPGMKKMRILGVHHKSWALA